MLGGSTVEQVRWGSTSLNLDFTQRVGNPREVKEGRRSAVLPPGPIVKKGKVGAGGKLGFL